MLVPEFTARIYKDGSATRGCGSADSSNVGGCNIRIADPDGVALTCHAANVVTDIDVIAPVVRLVPAILPRAVLLLPMLLKSATLPHAVFPSPVLARAHPCRWQCCSFPRCYQTARRHPLLRLNSSRIISESVRPNRGVATGSAAKEHIHSDPGILASSLLARANAPIAVLKLPSVLTFRANVPLAVFSVPVVLAKIAGYRRLC